MLAALAAAGVASRAGHLGDYALSAHIGDNPAPVIQSLLNGDVSGALAQQPVMGLFSILLRLPAAALARAIGGDELLTYRLGIFACAFVVGLVGIAIATAAVARGRSRLGGCAVAALVLLNPLTFDALWWGHPEEMLGGGLCVAAVLAGLRGRPVLAGAALGLALGTKEWALLAVIPTLIACPSGRVRLLAVAAALAAPLMLAMPLADPATFLRSAHGVGDLNLPTITSWWWPIANVHDVTVHVDGVTTTTALRSLPLGLTRSDVSWLAPAAALPLGWLYQRAPARDPANALGLLALLILLRCTLDPISMLYYHVPFVIALVAWEALTRRGLPIASLAAIVGLWATYDHVAGVAWPQALCYVALTVVLVTYISQRVFSHTGERRRGAAVPAVA